MNLIKTSRPDNLHREARDSEGFYNESTGMEYVIHTLDGVHYLESWHDGVGLVTWFIWYGTHDELETLLTEDN